MEEKKEEEAKKDQGPVVQGKGNIYGNAKVPVKVLDGVIIAGIALIVILVYFGIR